MAFAKSKRNERTWLASSYRKSVSVAEAHSEAIGEIGSVRSDAQKTGRGHHITKERYRNEKLAFWCQTAWV